jgi:DNA mismatch repair protein MutS
MDEIGRGTSTKDGLAIAWAITEYFSMENIVKTLFATHYHELTILKNDNIQNLSMDVLERNGEIVFLKKIKNEPTNNSYGIHVARLAGLPSKVTLRADEILEELLENESNGVNSPKVRNKPTQRNLFDPKDILLKEIFNTDIDNTTPMDALNLLYEWKKKIGKLDQN